MGQEAVGQRFGPVLRRYDVGLQAVRAERFCRGTADDTQPEASQGTAVFLKFPEAAEEAVDAVAAGKEQPVVRGQVVNGLIEGCIVV